MTQKFLRKLIISHIQLKPASLYTRPCDKYPGKPSPIIKQKTNYLQKQCAHLQDTIQSSQSMKHDSIHSYMQAIKPQLLPEFQLI